jgi:hypothetical protein
LKDALAAGCCLATTFFGLLLAAGFLAVTFLAVGVSPAPGFLVAVLPVLAFRTESRDDGVFLAATFDGLIFALGAPAVGFFGFVDAAPGRETLMSPPVERPAGRAFGAFTVGRLVGLLR